MRQEDAQQGCNLFARELDDILRHHGTGTGLGQLGKPGLIHPQVVDRLRKSLKQLSFYTLSPQDLQIVIMQFELNNEEKYRLQAALLATAVAQKLMQRIVPSDAEFFSPEDVFLLSPEDVCRAAEEVFNILHQAMREQGKVKARSALLAVRKGKGAVTQNPDLLKLETILTRFERAMMALHMSHSARTHEEKIEEANLARAGFEAALSQLNEVSPALKARDEWIAWRTEFQRGLDEAKTHLHSLGE